MEQQVVEVISVFHGTFWALVPSVVAIILALITKEAYSSLFIGIVIGGLRWVADIDGVRRGVPWLEMDGTRVIGSVVITTGSPTKIVNPTIIVLINE